MFFFSHEYLIHFQTRSQCYIHNAVCSRESRVVAWMWVAELTLSPHFILQCKLSWFCCNRKASCAASLCVSVTAEWKCPIVHCTYIMHFGSVLDRSGGTTSTTFLSSVVVQGLRGGYECIASLSLLDGNMAESEDGEELMPGESGFYSFPTEV